MNLLSGKKSVKHHSKNCREDNANLVKTMQRGGRVQKGCIFTHERLLIVLLFLFFKGSFLVTCDGHWATCLLRLNIDIFVSSYVFNIYFRTIKIQICDKGLKVKMSVECQSGIYFCKFDFFNFWSSKSPWVCRFLKTLSNLNTWEYSLPTVWLLIIPLCIIRKHSNLDL